jgi:competence protein ComEC
LLHHRFRRTSFLLAACLAFLAGVGLAHGGYILSGVWLVATACVVLVTFRRHSMWTLFWVVVFGLCLGWWRGSIYMLKLAEYHQYYFNKTTLIIQANNDAVYGINSQLSFDAGNVALPSGQKLAGKVEVSGFGVSAVFQGDTIEATGKLYPALGAYQGRMSFASLVLIKRHPSLVADLRRKFTAGMQSALPEPLASFAMGLLIGQRATLPANVKQDLLMVGLTHIIAVSGYNLTIMLHASQRLFGKRSKRLATFLSLTLISIFLLFAGASASIVRAAIVSTLSIFAGYYGRSFRPLALIALAAAITVWANPFYVWTDTSWYLSFLSFYGVMVLSPLLAVRLPPSWHQSIVLAVALESLCAEIMTMPFVLHTFGQMSFIGLPANVLVVALVPLAMLLSLVAGLAGMLVAPVSGWLAWPARLLLNYMLDTAHILAAIPHIFVQNLALSLSEMIGLYILTAVMCGLLWYKSGSKSAIITDKKSFELRSPERMVDNERTLEMVNH